MGRRCWAWGWSWGWGLLLVLLLAAANHSSNSPTPPVPGAAPAASPAAAPRRGASGATAAAAAAAEAAPVVEIHAEAAHDPCYDTFHALDEWWQYKWCPAKYVRQLHYDWVNNVVEANNLIGNYIKDESDADREVYRRVIADCAVAGRLLRRQAQVLLRCCGADAHAEHGEVFIRNVTENRPCKYTIEACSASVCLRGGGGGTAGDGGRGTDVEAPGEASNDDNDDDESTEDDDTEDDDDDDTSSRAASMTSFSDFVLDQIDPRLLRTLPTPADAQANLKRVKAMFYHAYDSYVGLAMPEAELRPLSCDGGQFELIKIPLVTLIDTLDTLVIMGNYTEFRRAVSIITKYYDSFDMDVNVSVFETNIRVLGGLLSAHLMATDPALGIYRNTSPYGHQLLALSVDLADRLLPAFKTATGIPYGTVNLRHGVPDGETEIASTAGAGSLFMEFETLSMLTGDKRYGEVANAAVLALYARRSFLGLVGKHIHVATGQWFESSAGIGSNADSFYEYLIKGYLMFRRNHWFKMFADTYVAVKKHIQMGDWFTEVDMFNAKSRRNRVENLQAFWPGMEASLGYCERSARLLNAFYAAWQDIGFLPEEFDQAVWLQGDTPVNDSWYPLRPELIESTYYQYRATGDRSWLAAGTVFLNSIEKNTRTPCGYASISNIGSMQMTNNMPSYFLSETCKYLFLLFDEHNFIHDRAYLFSTEAHPIDPMQLLDSYERRQRRNNATTAAAAADDAAAAAAATPPKRRTKATQSAVSAALSLKCPKAIWWDAPRSSYDAQFLHTHPDASGESSGGQWHSSQRVSTQEINAAEVARLLRWAADPSTPLVRREEFAARSDAPPPPKRADTCYDEDAAGMGTPKAPAKGAGAGADGGKANAPAQSPATSPPPPATPQKLEVDAGPLGPFEVTVYSDGFLVLSKVTGEVVEITNVGDSIVFVRELRNGSSRTVIGDQTTGKTIACTVSVESQHGAPLLEGPDHRLSCSISTFGTAAFHSASVVASLHVPPPHNSMLCRPLSHDPAANPSRPAAPPPRPPRDAGPPAAAGDNAAGAAVGRKKQPWWWQLSSVLSLAGMGARRGAQKPPPENPAAAAAAKGARGSVVLATRGGCLFEDKARNAQHAGAAAMLVVNSEDVLFVMSGKKQHLDTAERTGAHDAASNSGGGDDDAAAAARALPAPAAAPTEDVTLPAVMITRADEKRLRAAVARDPTGGARVRLEVAAVPSMLDTDLMGHGSFPKLRIGQKMVHVIGSAAWGVVLTTQNGKEWQLFIMDKNDIMSSAVVTPWIVLTSGGQTVTTTVAGTINPLDVYKHLLGRKCPAYVALDEGDGIVIQKPPPPPPEVA